MSSPLILGFDTSAAHCAAALLRGDTVLASHVENMTRGQAEHLMPLLENVLSRGGAAWADLDAIGVGTGPGNFTGVRISVSAARGLSLALKIPAIGVDMFDVAGFESDPHCATWVPAPRDQAYLRKPGATPVQVPRAELSQTDLGIPDPQRIAQRIARLAAARVGTDQPPPAPVYLRPADAAPPRDPAPIIVP